LCGSRKYTYPPQGVLLEISRGRGVSKAKSPNERMSKKWNFQRDGEWIFSGTKH